MAKATELDRPALVICRCPQHKFWAVTLDVAGGGTRVTPSKCCGRWDTVQRFELLADWWDQLSQEASAMAAIVRENERETGDPHA